MMLRWALLGLMLVLLMSGTDALNHFDCSQIDKGTDTSTTGQFCYTAFVDLEMLYEQNQAILGLLARVGYNVTNITVITDGFTSGVAPAPSPRWFLSLAMLGFLLERV